jgi:Mg-chelatase subunit ChlD
MIYAKTIRPERSWSLFRTAGRMSVSRQVKTLLKRRYILCNDIYSAGIQSVLIHTETGLMRLGKMRELTHRLDGVYYHMDNIRSDTVTTMVKEALSRT